MVGTSKDKGDLETLVAATKESYQSPADVNTFGIATAVVEGRRNILEGIVRAAGQLNAYPAVVATPYLIWTSPLEIVIDSNIEPWNNRARVYAVRNNGGDDLGRAFYDVGFFYFWDNPSLQNYALVNLASTLATKGFVSATGNTGIFSGSFASLSANTQLILYQGATGDAPLEPQVGSTVSMYSVQAQGGGALSGETGRINTRGVFYEAAIEYRYYPVPPGARAIFEVRLNLTTQILNSGSVWFDFANVAQDNYVQCPALIITVLSGL